MQTNVTFPRLFLTGLLCFMLSGLFAQPAQDAPVGPTTTIEFTETQYDFGTILQGEIVRHVYTFTNTGEEPLLLSNVRGSCGCTVPRWPVERIAPGETASITVEFDSKGKKGRQSKKVTLTGNTDPAQTFVYLNGEVEVSEDGPVQPDITVEEPTAISPDCFAIYPNPTAELLQLEMEARHLGNTAIISIFSKEGQLMAEREIPQIEGPIEFNVSHYPAGTYMAHVRVFGEEPQVKCFVVVD